MKYQTLTVKTANEAREAVEAYLMELGSLGNETRDKADFKAAANRPKGEVIDWSEIENLPDDTEITGYFAEEADMQKLQHKMQQKLIEIANLGLKVAPQEIAIGEVADTDWNEAWKKFYHVTHLSRYMTIVPEWEDYTPADQNENIVKLDPGLAFGTGDHPTTALTALAMEKIVRPGTELLDVGTGSGILAIIAAKLGAQKIVASDIDQESLTAAKENLALNQVAKKVDLVQSDLLESITGQYDVIVANILTDILLRLLPTIDQFLKPHGRIIFSGIDQDQLAKITTALKKSNFHVSVTLSQNRWRTLIIERGDAK